MTAPVWLFDDDCVLCSWGVRYTLRHERPVDAHDEIRFVALHSPQGMALARDHGIDPDDPTSFLFIEDGTALTQADGVIALVAHLSGPARLLRLGRFLPRRARDAAYRFVATNRYRIFGRLDVCMVPDADQRHRFVLPDAP